MNEILVVEDEPIVSSYLSMVLTRYGWTVKIAETLGEALAILRVHRFDVVWLDLNLGDSGWQQTLERVPEIVEVSRPARVIVASNYIPEGAVFPHGVRVLFKALTIDQILSAIGDPTPL